MAYICTDIINQGTEDDFLNALGDFFERNGLVTFSVTRNFDEEPHSVTIDYGNLRYEVRSKGSQYQQNYLTWTNYLVVEHNQIQKTTQDICYMENIQSVNSNETRKLKIMLVKNQNAFFLGIGTFNSTKSNFTTKIISSVMDNGERLSGFMGAGAPYTDDNNIDIYYPYTLHKSPYDNGKLIIEKNVSITYPNQYTHFGNWLNIDGLVGASSGQFYLIDNVTYYSILSNIAIKMGDEVIYKSNENI